MQQVYVKVGDTLRPIKMDLNGFVSTRQILRMPIDGKTTVFGAMKNTQDDTDIVYVTKH